MRTPMLPLAILTALVLTAVSGSAQGFKIEPQFECGTIALNGSEARLYQDYGRGLRFEFPRDWKANRQFLSGPGKAEDLMFTALIAPTDPRFYLKESAKPTGTEIINGLTWTTLKWQNGTLSYYTYSHGVAIELTATAYSKDKTVALASLAALQQVLSTFTFFDSPYRVDRQLAALKVGQKFGELTVKRIIPGPGGFEHPLATVEFAGRLRVTGEMVLPSPTMLGGWGPYQLYPDDDTRQSMPHLKCPVENLGANPDFSLAVEFSNQGFTNQQFARVPSISGNHAWYQAETTVILDRVTQTFSSYGETAPSISARLIKVIGKKEGQ